MHFNCEFFFCLVSSAITVTSNEAKISKKDRCKFYPSCTRGDRCDYYHPSTPCKSFPNCKYGDACLYIHPKCKFDLTCSRLDCSFTHTPVASAAPPLGRCSCFFFFRIYIFFQFDQNILITFVYCSIVLYSFSCSACIQLQKDRDDSIAHVMPILSELFQYTMRILSSKTMQIW